MSVKMLREYWESHPSRAYSKGPLSAWHKVSKAAAWKTPMDVKATFGNASVRPGGRVVFNAGGNKLRIVTDINYAAGVVYVKFVGDHNEYDAINVDIVDQTK